MKIWFITRCSSGNGKGIAKAVLENGNKVVISTQNVNTVKEFIDDYSETTGKARKENVVNLENQPGDPNKAGKVLVQLVEKGNLPLRLLLGSDAVKLVETELENRLVELRSNKSMSLLTDYTKEE